MPTSVHDALNALFRNRPTLAIELLDDAFEIDLPADTLVEVAPTDLKDIPVLDRDLDLFFSVGRRCEPSHGVIVEMQQALREEERQDWARRAAGVWLRLNRPVLLLVLAPDPQVAAWASQPIVTSLPGYVLHPLVVGPDQITIFSDPSEAADCLELAVLSVVAHGKDREVVETFLSALSKVDEDHGAQYHEYAYCLASADVRQVMEEIMSSATWPVYSPFAREHFTNGRAAGLSEGKARAVLTVLKARGVAVSDDALTAITSCTDQERLDDWAHRAATALTVDELFE
ncbi:hypothetical protein [Nonomuraea jiangxiensis]|uniref:Uncharacterized protein n=1 Tax=Nonomuraea jiangxiensis TaxID=633440 RepID=A0A1G8Z9R7_9ACTN|nr:hypothetical protein [Nonomuraea jiangxiensis]SDK11846.1 hypothetical protein SAMN05421869_1142 [Nonomuraea jiangxiensis]